MVSATRSTRRSSPVALDAVTSNTRGSAPAMRLNEALYNEEVVLKMQSIKQSNIYPAEIYNLRDLLRAQIMLVTPGKMSMRYNPHAPKRVRHGRKTRKEPTGTPNGLGETEESLRCVLDGNQLP